MRGYRLSIIRHGATEATEKGVYIGKTDYPLSENGKRELMDKLSLYEYPSVTRVYTSPLKRCVETAGILFPNAQIIGVDNLAEMDFGDFDGKSVDELVNREDFKKWLKGGIDNAAPNGESLSELTGRSLEAIREIFADMMEEGLFHCAAVTHSGVLANMLSCFGIPKNPPSEYSCGCGEGYDVMLTTQLWHQAQAFEILGMTPYVKDESRENDE